MLFIIEKKSKEFFCFDLLISRLHGIIIIGQSETCGGGVTNHHSSSNPIKRERDELGKWLFSSDLTLYQKQEH